MKWSTAFAWAIPVWILVCGAVVAINYAAEAGAKVFDLSSALFAAYPLSAFIIKATAGDWAAWQPESKWVITIDSDRINVRDVAGQVNFVAKGDLTGVAIETNDSGPWGIDFWWLLFERKDQLACVFPQGATGEEAFIEYISALPSFDHGALGKAISSTDNATFHVWQRQG